LLFLVFAIFMYYLRHKEQTNMQKLIRSLPV
jgi:hypothetical protein